MARSQNGYTANNRLLTKQYTAPGTQVKLTLRRGATATVLLYVASQFDHYVEDIDNARGALDDWGYAERPIRGTTTVLSNHASGTAIDLNATRHPLGTGPADNFTAAQIRQIRRILDDCDRTVRWGGDYAGRKDPMHFEIDASAARVALVAAKLAAGKDAMPLSDKDINRLVAKLVPATRDAVLGAQVGRGTNRRTIAQAIGTLQDQMATLLTTPKDKP